MNLSDDWRFLFPVSSVFDSQSLAQSTSPYGPLLFSPLPPPATLLSLPFPFQPPHSYTRGLRHILRHVVASTSFLPFSHLDSLSGDLLARPSPPFQPPRNLLAALRAARSLLLFFPHGENAEHVAFVALDPSAVDVSAPLSPFVQSEGFKHPLHRIQQLAVSAAQPSWSSCSVGSLVVEGFLLAATLYSVSWFKVASSGGSGSPSLVPVAKQGFEDPVVHACWSKHLPSESAVLLDSGELCWFDLDTRRGGKMRVASGSNDDWGDWLGCEYGAQPWVLIVASTKAVLSVDLRYGDRGERKVLARVGMPGLYETEPLAKTGSYLAFCKARFDDFHISVVTERHLMLLDVRQPMTPVLAWQHRLDNPTHVAMFQLSELRPSKEHEWASNSGFAILVGSLWNTEFNLFCYGPKEQGCPDGSHLYAWDLPSGISLTGQHCNCSKLLMKDVFAIPVSGYASAPQLIWNSIVGYYMLANTMLEPTSTGFTLIRLTSSGKLEMQRYQASGDLHDDVICDESQHESGCSSVSIGAHGETLSNRFLFLKLRYLSEHLEGNLWSTLDHDFGVKRVADQIIISEDVSAFAKDNARSCSPSVSDFLCSSTVPMNMFEIAYQSILNGLHSNILHVTFSKYKDMLACSKEKGLHEFLEVPACLPQNKLRPFLLAQSSNIGEKLTGKAISGNALVGPVLPIHVLLAMENGEKGIGSPSQGEIAETDSIRHRCSEVLDAFVPEISIAGTGNGNGWSASQELKDDKPYFVYEPQIENRFTLDETARKEKEAQVDDRSCLQTPAAPYKDDNFMTFVCGRSGIPHSEPEQAASDLFDFGPVKMDFESPVIDVSPAEEKIYKCLKKQFLTWQNNFKPYQDFCGSYKIQKPPQ